MVQTLTRTENNPKVRIRKGKKSDATSLAVLSGELGYPTNSEEMSDRLRRLLSDPRHAIYVAEIDAIVGWIHVSVLESLESGFFAEILGMVVTEPQRGKGIGKRLVEEAEGWAGKKGCARLRVRSNIIRAETHAFYGKLGYATKKTQKVFEKLLDT